MILDPPWHTHKEIRESFAETVYRLLKPGGYALVYTGHKGLFEFGDELRAVGLIYRWLITCVNDDGAGAIRNDGSVYKLSRLVSVYQKGGSFKTVTVGEKPWRGGGDGRACDRRPRSQGRSGRPGWSRPTSLW